MNVQSSAPRIGRRRRGRQCLTRIWRDRINVPARLVGEFGPTGHAIANRGNHDSHRRRGGRLIRDLWATCGRLVGDLWATCGRLGRLVDRAWEFCAMERRPPEPKCGEVQPLIAPKLSSRRPVQRDGSTSVATFAPSLDWPIIHSTSTSLHRIAPARKAGCQHSLPCR